MSIAGVPLNQTEVSKQHQHFFLCTWHWVAYTGDINYQSSDNKKNVTFYKSKNQTQALFLVC